MCWNETIYIRKFLSRDCTNTKASFFRGICRRVRLADEYLQKGHRPHLLFGSFFGMIKVEIGKYLLKGVLLPMKIFAKIISFVILAGALASLIKVLIDLFYDKCDEPYFSSQEIE